MIKVHRLNDSEFYINAHQIEYIEETPDTVIHLINEKTYVVKESAMDIIEKIIKYNQIIYGKNINDDKKIIEELFKKRG